MSQNMIPENHIERVGIDVDGWANAKRQENTPPCLPIYTRAWYIDSGTTVH